MNELLGGNNLDFYFGWFVFAFIGFVIHKYLLFRNRTIRKPFKLGYFLRDNAIDILAGFFFVFVLGRFQKEMLEFFGFDYLLGISDSLKALFVGVFYTTLIQIARKTKLGDLLKSSKYSDGADRN